MEPIFVDRRSDRRDFGDLMSDRFGIVAEERPTAASTFGRPALDDLTDLLGRYEGPDLALMTGLPEGAAGGRRLTEGGSDEGGLEELTEFLPTRSSNSAIRRSNDNTSAATAVCASGKSESQMICGSNG